MGEVVEFPIKRASALMIWDDEPYIDFSNLPAVSLSFREMPMAIEDLGHGLTEGQLKEWESRRTLGHGLVAPTPFYSGSEDAFFDDTPRDMPASRSIGKASLALALALIALVVLLLGHVS